MTHLIERTTRAARQRLSSVLLAPAPQPVDDALRRFSRRWPATDLAAPPSGSDLRPIRGDYGTPLVGHVLDYIRFGTDFARERYDRYGPVTWMGAFGTRIATVAGPEATQLVLTNKDKAFSQAGWTFLIDQFFHRGLMLLDFDEHKMHRRIMQHAFTRDRLAGYTQQVGPCVRATVPTWSTTHPVRLYWLLKDLTLDIATRVFMGGRGDGVDSERINHAFVATVRAASSLVRYPLPGTRYRAGLRGRRVLERYFAHHLPAARAGNGEDLFSALCQATTPEGEQFSDDDVINHMIFLMMAAHDTSTITTTAAAYYLATHPHWQDRARQESLALGDDLPDIDALERLDTLDLVIKEALRLLAPVPLVMRKTVTDTEILGHYLPADTLVAVAPAINHFVPECWTDPDTFDPDRFAAHRREDQNHRFAWIPFGGGVHKCIGMHFGTLEVKAILHEMLRTHHWSVPDGYRVRWDNTSLPIPTDGLPVHLTRR
ncbi:cytochrome P450 [Amycolatopsis acidiphila]|uniref:Cytochrome P450 n=2 Tax=Amycolatopsis TaxID=1813 RepID=A0A558A7P5_9PSEU|nr:MULTISPECIES: cytochrome P450 [Amycolatopsis]PKV92526.1 cytochrome P450 [Amycolatopsis niigatensis]TVT20275.1 cytochrome P450 [Amycolatopsis acidiphila]UIJ59716.1 cytochrome P450 [Amycolatopsis acidiphila]GHG81545.1 putative cytochrome P450 [Amycolatopsis acidiphila]